MVKGFGDKGRRVEMRSRAHHSTQDMRRLILWEATAMIVASPDGFASDLRRNLALLDSRRSLLGKLTIRASWAIFFRYL
jgi:hypothetical protein